MNLVAVPTGTYSIIVPAVKGYSDVSPTTVEITGASALNVTLGGAYLPYSNSLAVTVAGITSGSNAIWTLTGPSAFTNAVSYGTVFTNTFTVSGIPTGLYTIAFPAIVGYTTPTNASTNITGASPLINGLIGTYASVIWGTNTSTNTPATNFPAYTNAITLMVTTNGLFKTPSREKIIAANNLLTTNTWEAVSNQVQTDLDSLKGATNGAALGETAFGWGDHATNNYVDASVTNGINSVLTDARALQANSNAYFETAKTNLSARVDGLTNGAALGETAMQPASTNGWEIGSHASLLVTNGAGAGLTGITAAQVGAASTNDFADHEGNLVVDVLHFSAAEKAIATNPPSTNGLASTNWVIAQGYATGTPLFVETYLGTIIGGTIVTGATASVTTNAGVLAFIVPSGGGGGAGTITNVGSSGGSLTATTPGGPNVDLKINTNQAIIWASGVTNSMDGLILSDTSGVRQAVTAMQDPPFDGLTYGRKNGAWVVLP